MNGGSLRTRSFRRIYLSAFRYRLIKNGLTDLKGFGGFREMGPGLRGIELRQSVGSFSSVFNINHIFLF